MARDAIARQYDVERNSMNLTCEGEKGSYRLGTITFSAKKGKSFDIDKIRESIAATRLSGGTSMRVEWFEVTVTGAVENGANLVLKSSGSGHQFALGEEKTAPGMEKKLRDAIERGEKVTSVTGRVPGWTGVFPKVLPALAKTPDAERM